MNAKFIRTSALVVTMLAGLLALYRADWFSHAEDSAKPEPRTNRSTTRSIFAEVGDPKVEDLTKYTAGAHSQTIAPSPSGNIDKTKGLLGIPNEFQVEASRRAQEMIANLDASRAALTDARYYNRSLITGQPAKKLALRLEVSAETAKVLDAVFAEELSHQVKRGMQVEQERIDREARLLAGDRDGYVSFLALEAMQSQGRALSAGQTEFYDHFRDLLEPSAAAQVSAEVPWYENPSMMEALSQQLSASESAELAVYVQEQKDRDVATQTMQAQMRASRIAEQLGLNHTDESVLLEYLKGNPNASNGDVASMLPAELKKLLPSGM